MFIQVRKDDIAITLGRFRDIFSLMYFMINSVSGGHETRSRITKSLSNAVLRTRFGSDLNFITREYTWRIR